MRLSLILAASLALGLAGCGGGIPGLGGGSQTSTPPEQQSGAGATARNLLLYGGPTVPQSQQPGFNQDKNELGCPELGILENAAGYRGGTAAQQASGVAFQASIANTARECIFQGNQLRLRVGVEGRVLLGQNGKPGTFTVPVRVVVKRRNDIVAQRFARLSVTVPGNDTQADFAHVEENILIPITENDPGDEYDVYVGLDPTGQQAQRQTRTRR
jgi:hypothetical protein